MPQDQLFKHLLQTFFREFMELFYPTVADRLNFDTVSFLDKELFTDLPDGARREADLVAQVQTKQGEPELILVHTEVQNTRRSDMPMRMWEYYALLRLRRKLPVFPIVVYLSPGAGGLVSETYEERLWDTPILTFVYQAVGLPDLDANQYLSRPGALSPALSSLMRLAGTRRVIRRLKTIGQAGILQADEARQALLLAVIEKYLPLNADEQSEFDQLLTDPTKTEEQKVMLTYEKRGYDKGIEQGIERGIEQGIKEGILRGARRTLLGLLRARFGEVPQGAVDKVNAAPLDEIDALTTATLSAPTLDAMGL